MQDTLVLQAVVTEIEIPAAFLERKRTARIIPQFGNAPPDIFSLWNRFEKGKRALVLRIHPCPGFRSIQIFQPSPRIGDRFIIRSKFHTP